MAGLLRLVRTALQRHPVLVASLQTSTLMMGGDVICQTWLEGHRSVETYEWFRTARFGLIGSVVVGPSVRIWYGFLQRRFGEKGFQTVAQKLVVDQLVFAPVFTLVLLYSIFALEGQRGSQLTGSIAMDYTDVVIAGWMVWPWVQICNFAVVPLKHQVLFVQTFALFWNTYLSWKVNGEKSWEGNDSTPEIAETES